MSNEIRFDPIAKTMIPDGASTAYTVHVNDAIAGTVFRGAPGNVRGWFALSPTGEPMPDVRPGDDNSFPNRSAAASVLADALRARQAKEAAAKEEASREPVAPARPRVRILAARPPAPPKADGTPAPSHALPREGLPAGLAAPSPAAASGGPTFRYKLAYGDFTQAIYFLPGEWPRLDHEIRRRSGGNIVVSIVDCPSFPWHDGRAITLDLVHRE
jgi:hypothetical protein